MPDGQRLSSLGEDITMSDMIPDKRQNHRSKMRVEIKIKNYLSEIDLKSKPISEKKKIFQIVLNTAHQSRRISQSKY